MTTNLIYDGGRVVQEWQGGTRTGAYVWGAAGLVRHNGEYPLSDAQGNTRVVSDGGGNPTCFLNADASGIEWGSGGGTSDPYAWGGDSGYRMDGDGPAGGNPYYKVGCRYYDQDYARFLSRDTDLSQSPYAYCDGDPVNFNDPDGHAKKKDPDSPKPKPGSADDPMTIAKDMQDVGTTLMRGGSIGNAAGGLLGFTQKPSQVTIIVGGIIWFYGAAGEYGINHPGVVNAANSDSPGHHRE